VESDAHRDSSELVRYRDFNLYLVRNHNATNDIHNFLLLEFKRGGGGARGASDLSFLGLADPILYLSTSIFVSESEYVYF